MDIAGVKLANPTMLASGILGLSAKIFKRIHEAGAGAVVTKSISLQPREPYNNPTVIGIGCGLLNAVGLANPGAEAFAEELSEMDGDLPRIVSVFGSSAEEMSKVVSVFRRSRVAGFELNLSCPHVKKIGLELGSDPDIVGEVVSQVKKTTSKPVFAKLSPNLTEIVTVAKAAESAGADAITATNTLRAMAIDATMRTPILSNKIGGLSGPALKPVSLRCVYEVSQAVRIPVIGCGGIEKWSDALEYFMAGASAVQIGTAVAYKGIGVFRAVSEGLRRYLLRNRLESVKDVIGIAHRA